MKTTLTLKVDEVQATREFSKVHGWVRFSEGGEAYTILALPPKANVHAGQSLRIEVTLDRREGKLLDSGFRRRCDDLIELVDRTMEATAQ